MRTLLPRPLHALLGRHRRALALALLALALTRLLSGLGEPVHGDHVFRQAHVAANIDKYVAHGLSLRPETYNRDMPLSLFDFPAYQLLAAGVCRLFGTEALPTARALSVAAFAIAFLSLERLLALTGVGAMPSLLSLLLFAAAPLDQFYFQAPMIDGLAVAASLLSLVGFAVWERGRAGAAAGYALMLLAGAFAALVKSPVYFPFVVAIAWARWRRRRWRGLRDPALLAFVAVVGAVVVAFKVYSNRVNQVPAFLESWEEQAYFGPLSERLSLADWAPLAATLGGEILSPPGVAFLLLGAVFYGWRSRHRARGLYGGLLLGTLVSLGVFFGRHHWHNYYQLPFVFPLAFFTAQGVRAALVLSRAARRRGRRLAAAAGPGLALALVLVTPVFAAAGLRQMSAPAGPVAVRGEWIRATTRPDDFVVYVRGAGEGNWNPSFLYFARRDGYNVSWTSLEPEELATLYRRFADGRRFLVFCPLPKFARAQARLESLGLPRLACGEPGCLYLVGEAWARAAEAAGGRGRP